MAKSIGKDSTRGYVYVVKAVGLINGQLPYKIGKTRNIEDRLAMFGVKLPFNIEIEHVIKTANRHRLEAKLHLHFGHKRLQGEWFDLNEDDLIYIKALPNLIK